MSNTDSGGAASPQAQKDSEFTYDDSGFKRLKSQAVTHVVSEREWPSTEEIAERIITAEGLDLSPTEQSDLFDTIDSVLKALAALAPEPSTPQATPPIIEQLFSEFEEWALGLVEVSRQEYYERRAVILNRLLAAQPVAPSPKCPKCGSGEIDMTGGLGKTGEYSREIGCAGCGEHFTYSLLRDLGKFFLSQPQAAPTECNEVAKRRINKQEETQ